MIGRFLFFPNQSKKIEGQNNLSASGAVYINRRELSGMRRGKRELNQKPRRRGGGRHMAIRLTVSALCLGMMVVLGSPGQSVVEPPQVSPTPQAIHSRANLTRQTPEWIAQGKAEKLCTGERVDDAERAEIVRPYDFSQPVPQSEPVGEDYFADAAFVGDSRTDGLLIYSGIKGAANLSYKGLTVQSAQTKAVTFTGRSDKISALDALEEKQYGKVYIMLGINELGWNGTDQYRQEYDKLLSEIRSRQPEALVYIQGTLPVAPSAAQQKWYLNNERVEEYNAVARQLAQEHEMYYLNVGECMADETGALPEEAGVDGIHLTRTYYKKWYEYLKCHTVVED